ncbi:hypothetical protein SMICM304S_10666 [Streptomyces microflavus]
MSQQTQPTSAVTGVNTSWAPPSSRGGLSYVLIWSRLSPSHRIPGRIPSIASAQPPRLNWAARAITSASRIRRRAGHSGSTVCVHTHSRTSALRRARSSRSSAAGSGPRRLSARSARARSGGVARTRSSSWAKVAGGRPGGGGTGVGVRKSALQRGARAVRMIRAESGSSDRSRR